MIELNEKTWIAIEDMLEFNYPVDLETFFDDFSIDKMKELCGDRKFIVFNDTDQIWASMDIMSIEQAIQFMEDFPKRYELQGYYRTAQGIAIPISCIRLSLLPYIEEYGDANFDPLPF
jgi:transcriptional regulatory protein LevR